MAKALDASDYIYQGFWINWGKGRILGSTLTLSTTNSTLLTNMLALFVAMAGSQFWTIVRFALHQLRASSKVSDRQYNMLYNKEQVVLRNTTSAITTAQLLLTLRWSSRRIVSQPPSNIIPVVVLAIFSAAFFLIAGAFSNTLTSAGPHVLSRSPLCGFWNQTYLNIYSGGIGAATGNVENLILANEAISKNNHDTELSLQYAQGCYLGQSTQSSNCDTFQASALKITMTNDTECPFKTEICRPGAGTVIFDTGLIDTHTDLGINAPERDRLSLRRVTKCTVLNNTKLTTGWVNQSTVVENSTQPTWQISYANFGYSINWIENVTYSYTNFKDFYTPFAGDWADPYQLGYDEACAKGSTEDQCFSSFAPIPELEESLSEADLVLLHLGFTGSYMGLIDDPWFSAHEPVHLNTSLPFLKTTYSLDKPISTMGCTEQHQVCAGPSQCTPLLGFSQVQHYLKANIHLTPAQNITLDRLLNVAGTACLSVIADTFTSVSVPLLAGDKTLVSRDTISLPLPDDQWKRELQYWQSISMAQLQRGIVQYGTGQIAPQPQYLLAPSTDAEKWICQNLMIRSIVYQSFSILALSLIIVIGLLVIILSFRIEEVAAWLWRRLGQDDACGEVWKDHNMLGGQVWRARVAQANILCRAAPVLQSQVATLPSYSEAEKSMAVHNDVQASRRISSQTLSLEDCERLRIARAYDSWI